MCVLSTASSSLQQQQQSTHDMSISPAQATRKGLLLATRLYKYACKRPMEEPATRIDVALTAQLTCCVAGRTELSAIGP